MTPSLFSRPIVDQTQIHVQTSFHTETQSQSQMGSTAQRQSKLKTISSLFHHPFAPQIPQQRSITASPPQVIKYYQQPVGYASPSRVGLPQSSTSSLIHRSQGTTPTTIVGLPTPVKRVSYTSHTLQAQIQRQMPTLASAIHIPDALPIAPALSSQNGKGTVGRTAASALHANLSSASLHEEIEATHTSNDVEGRKRDRSDSRASTVTTGSTRRRMSRRLSLDNILPRITGSLRKKDRPASGAEPLLEKSWPTPDTTDSKHASSNSGPAFEIKINSNPMAMPAMRTWRSKFAVGRDKSNNNGGILAAAKADLAAKQAKLKSTEGEHLFQNNKPNLVGKKYDERTIRRVPVRGGMTSLSSLTKPSEGNGFRHLIDRPSSITSSSSYNDPAATPRSAPSPAAPTGLTHASHAATLDSPSPLPLPVHTPLSSAPLHVQYTAQSFLFSPAQDDMSIVDPESSPMPMHMAEPVPALPSQNRQQESQTESTSMTQIRRQQSLSEIRGAFSQLRDLSELDPIPAPTARRPSGTGPDERYKHRRAEGDPTFAVSRSTSLASSAMMTAPSQPVSIQSHSGQSWHTASGSIDIYGPLPPLPTGSSATGLVFQSQQSLPRSRSKSHTDLSTFSSSKDLVEHTEKTQGPGWWSTDERLDRRASAIDDSTNDRRSETQDRMAKSSTFPQRARFDDECVRVEDDALPSHTSISLEGMRPRSSIDLRRTKLISPSRSSLSRESSDDIPRPRTSMSNTTSNHGARLSLVAGSTWGKPESPRRTVLSRRSTMTLSQSQNRVDGVDCDESTTPTRSRPLYIGSGPFVSSRISPDIARRAGWIAQRYSGEEAGAIASSPSRASSWSKQVATASSISPSRPVSRQTTRTTLSTSTAPTSLVPSDSESDSHPSISNNNKSRLEEKLAHLQDRHTLELDAVLAALGSSKAELQNSKGEIASLHRLLGEGVEERHKLRDKVRELEGHVAALRLARMADEPSGDLFVEKDKEGEEERGMKRSISVKSALLPELINAPPSPLQETLPEYEDEEDEDFCQDNQSEDEIDEFGRRKITSNQSKSTIDNIGQDVKDKGGSTSSSGGGYVKGRRVISIATTSDGTSTESNVLFGENQYSNGGSGSGEEGQWTLRLSESDEKYLDDL